MKKVIISLTLLLTVFSMSSCDLDQTSDTTLGFDKISQVDDLYGIRLGAYRYFRYQYCGYATYYVDYMSNAFTELNTSGNRGGFFSRYTLQATDGEVEDQWNMHYATIAQCNLYIKFYDQVLEKNPGYKAQLDSWLGEMYLMRAMTHRQIAVLFSKPYIIADTTADWGIPVITKYDVAYKPSRGTLADTYKAIREDVAAAKSLLSAAGASGSKYLTKDCVTAFEALLAMDMGDYATASTKASSLYTAYPLVSSQNDLLKRWQTGNSSEIICKGAVTKTDLISRMKYTDLHGGTWTGEKYECNTAYIPTQEVVDMYDTAKDWRVNTYIKWETVSNQPTSGQTADMWVLYKFFTDLSLQSAATAPSFAVQPQILHIAQMYLIDAEAKAINNGDALTPLNALRQARGLDALSGVTGQALIDSVRVERTRELLGEGTHLYDMKRWGVALDRKGQTATGIGFNGVALNTKKPANYYMMVWPIPQREFEVVGSNITADQQNPGY